VKPSAERGSLTLELAIAAPVLIAVMLFIAGASAVQRARADLDDAAWEAARSASLARSPTDAEAAATAAVERRLAGSQHSCDDRVVDTDVSQFKPGGTVAIEISCSLPLSEAFGLFPGRVHLHSRAAEPLEPFRAVE